MCHHPFLTSTISHVHLKTLDPHTPCLCPTVLPSSSFYSSVSVPTASPLFSELESHDKLYQRSACIIQRTWRRHVVGTHTHVYYTHTHTLGCTHSSTCPLYVYRTHKCLSTSRCWWASVTKAILVCCSGPLTPERYTDDDIILEWLHFWFLTNPQKFTQ